MLEGAIFDLDGTLIDSMGAWDNVPIDYLHSVGCEPAADLHVRFRAMSQTQAAEYFISEYSVDKPLDDILKGINALIERYYFDSAELKHGVGELLEEMYAAGIKMCIATATDRYMVEAALKRCGIEKYFAEIFTCGEVGHAKNEPTIFRIATEFLGTDKSKTAVIEDSLHAITTATADGFPVVAVYDAFEAAPEKVKALADIYIDDFENDSHIFWEYAKTL